MTTHLTTELAGIVRQKKAPGAPSAARAHRSRLRLSGVPVFNYHGLAQSLSPEIPPNMQRFWLTPAQFRGHLAYIRNVGFRVAVLEELKEGASGHASQASMVVLTFDDGLASDYEFALPVLAEFGMRAVFFVNTSTVGQTGYLTWSQVTEMLKSGMSIQSHGHRHVDLTVLPMQALENELAHSKRSLEDRLGCPVEFLAAPHGLLNRRVVRKALATGYRAVCSTRCLPAHPGSSVFTRITVHSDISPEEFRGFLAGEVSRYASRLCRGLLHRPWRIGEHVVGVLRYRWLGQPPTVSN